jgi:rare lipoprotein A
VTYPKAKFRQTFFLLLLGFACFFALAGCASRHVTANPPPSQPAAAPPETIESSKRSTSVEPTPGAPALARSPKRGKSPGTPAPEGYIEEGNASWYGVPFNGRRASNGEIYDMNKLTAAHRTLPFDTMVRVTNLNNGRSVVVRITDRGPVSERLLIDMSPRAADELAMKTAGIVPVSVEQVVEVADASK